MHNQWWKLSRTRFETAPVMTILSSVYESLNWEDHMRSGSQTQIYWTRSFSLTAPFVHMYNVSSNCSFTVIFTDNRIRASSVNNHHMHIAECQSWHASDASLAFVEMWTFHSDWLWTQITKILVLCARHREKTAADCWQPERRIAISCQSLQSENLFVRLLFTEWPIAFGEIIMNTTELITRNLHHIEPAYIDSWITFFARLYYQSHPTSSAFSCVPGQSQYSWIRYSVYIFHESNKVDLISSVRKRLIIITVQSISGWKPAVSYSHACMTHIVTHWRIGSVNWWDHAFLISGRSEHLLTSQQTSRSLHIATNK
jgi:hypothetical protein